MIKERVTSRLLTVLSQNYRNPIEALLELIDNAVDDRIPDCLMRIEILISPNSIEVRNRGGRGMGEEELKNFLNWGASQKRQRVGRYGQGGKAACMYLGTELRLTCAHISDAHQYVLHDTSWGEREAEDDFRTYPAQKTVRSEDRTGFAFIEVRRLRKGRRMDSERLRDALGDVYRLPLREGSLHIALNGEPVTPLEIHADVRDEFDARINGPGRIRGWVGVAPAKHTALSGVRVCLLGRKIKDGERFGHPGPASKSSLARLVGEVDVEILEPTINKTDINRASLSWQRLEGFMRERLTPLVQELSQAPDEHDVSEDERERCRKVGKEFAEFLRTLRAVNELIGELSGADSDTGQKPRERREALEDRGEPQTRRGPNEPTTPPTPDAVGRRRRTKGVIQPELTHALPVTVRSRLEERQGAKVLLINTEFPAYKARKDDPLYLHETLCMEYAKPVEGETLDHVSYVAEYDRLLAGCCLFLQREEASERSKRKSARSGVR